MNDTPDPSGLDGIPPEALDIATTCFDYIVVGSGAGGAPLACRLARSGMRVLVLEAGVDPAVSAAHQETAAVTDAEQRAVENEHAIYHCPGLHGASSEPNRYDGTPDELQMSWDFPVRHYTDDADQDADPKAAPDPRNGGKNSVFYPRAAALGGCTSHNSMVTVYGTDREWRNIAELTGDASWGPERMRTYYQRLSRAQYGRYKTRLGKLWNNFLDWLDPARDAKAKQGSSGWLDITITDPKLAVEDPQLLKVILNVTQAELKGWRWLWRWIKRTVAGRLYRDLDPNDASRIRQNLEGVAFVPLAVSQGMRRGPREYMLQTRRELKASSKAAGELCIATGVFVKRVIFADGNDAAPRAVGVEFACGRDLYQASPRQGERAPSFEGQCFARREIILCGGAFNTPQLLMLSGIGDKSHMPDDLDGPRDDKGVAVADVIDLPGVGKRLQDRYEVSVITQMDSEFKTLRGVRFDPASSDDAALKAWRESRSGIYTTNGAAIAIIKKSVPQLEEPDLFIFGFPAAFRGYYHGWSKELLKASIHPPDDEPLRRDLWTWTVLKAYSKNMGEVRLRSADPFELPEINFRYFGDGSSDAAESDPDLEAVATAVAYCRGLNDEAADLIKDQDPAGAELEPGRDSEDGSDQLRDWIKGHAWGHHACGTCRIGKDSWRASVADLDDADAVIDSKFRVHGVQALRIVDASIFPDIPGYFIATPIYMVGEKAADTLLEDTTMYPPALENEEAAKVQARRAAANIEGNESRDGKLPGDTVGVAVSGGGIRSAIFSLGILQAMAQKNRLREVDFLSTISGGGYIGGFLCRLFTRGNVTGATDPCQAVQDILSDNQSPPLRWLRSNADYITGAGMLDKRNNIAVYWRNLFTIYFILACLALATFGLLRLASDYIPHWLQAFGSGVISEELVPSSILSPWSWLPLAIFCLGVVPATLAYWLAPKSGTRAILSFFPAVSWIAIMAGVIFGATLPGGSLPYLLVGLIAVITGVWLEVTRFVLRKKLQLSGRDAPDTGALMRNRLTRGLGEVATLFVLVTAFVILDTLARAFAQQMFLPVLMAWAALLAPVLPFLSSITKSLLGGNGDGQRKFLSSEKRRTLVAALVAFPLAGLLLVVADGTVHRLFDFAWSWGFYATALGILLTLILSGAFDFLNFSSLQKTYSARLARTFLGASNPHRIHGATEESCTDVQQIVSDDDIAFRNYHPEEAGGPLHLIGVCVNETIDTASGRDIRDRKGLLMTAGPCGLSVGRKYHALWTDQPSSPSRLMQLRRKVDSADAADNAAVHGVPVPGQLFHVLRGKDDSAIPVENLGLGTWVAVSAAAFGTGLGRGTSLPLALLCGLVNLRLGYWWDTRLPDHERPGRYRSNLWRRLKNLPASFAAMQCMLLREFTANFRGPGSRYWYLSDGGHFDLTGAYELIRRRTPLILVFDGAADPDNTSATNGDLVRQVRIDFGAEVDFLSPEVDPKLKGWKVFQGVQIPKLVQERVNPAALGAIDQLGTDGKKAAIARITYADNPEQVTWLILLKATFNGDGPLDLQAYKKVHPDFPNESTADQFFDELQWESYRKLGETIGHDVLK